MHFQNKNLYESSCFRISVNLRINTVFTTEAQRHRFLKYLLKIILLNFNG